MIEEDRRLLRTSQPVLALYMLCVNCEDFTGAKAMRQVTPEGRCSTCGSASLCKMPEHVWPWQKGEH